MEKHLSVEDIEKYMTTSDLSEDYLLWFESVTEHLNECEKCRNALQRAIALESLNEEEGLCEALKLAEQEEEIRRSIVICKLLQMQQQDRMAEVIRRLQGCDLTPYIIHRADFGRQVGTSRGNTKEEILLQDYPGAEITCENNVITVSVPVSKDSDKITVLLVRENGNPEVCEASAEEASQKRIARFSIDEQTDTFEIYIIP